MMSFGNYNVVEAPTLERSLYSGSKKEVITSATFNPCPSVFATRKQRTMNQDDKTQIASVTTDGILTLWNYVDADNEVRSYRFQAHDSTIHHVTYSPSGRLLATCSSDKTTKLWVPKRNGEIKGMLKGHNGAVRCVDFSHHRNEEDSFIVTCSDDKTLKIWNVANKSFRQSTIAHKNWVRSCKFSPDSKLIVSGGDDGTVKLWDSNRCDIIVTHKIPLLKTGSSNLELESVRGVHFHPHGNLIAASGSKGNTHMYDLRCDRLVHSMVEGAASPTNRSISKSVAFHSDGEHVLISNNDGDFSCLDTRTWRGLFSMTHTYQSTKKSASLVNDKYLCCDFSSDGSRVLTGGLDTRVLVWKFDKQDPYTCMKTIHSCVKSTIAGSIETDYTSNCEEHESKGNVEATTVMNPSNEDKNPLRFSDEVPLSEPLKNLIDHVICQLDTMTSTMICLEKRLQVQENELATLKSEYMTNRRIKNHER